jgi:hypothetical protein
LIDRSRAQIAEDIDDEMDGDWKVDMQKNERRRQYVRARRGCLTWRRPRARRHVRTSHARRHVRMLRRYVRALTSKAVQHFRVHTPRALHTPRGLSQRRPSERGSLLRSD